MQIIVTPNDIIQRCLWDKYKKFCLHDKDEDQIKKIVNDNKPISLSENDAYAIGLLKIIETNNLIHRFNENILDILQIKSNIIKDELYINKNTITKEISTYLDKFPDYYNPPFNYTQSLKELKDYINEISDKVKNLDIINVKQRDKIFVYYNSKDIRKCLTI
ncbi:hypothetical protein [Trichloromonas sp.]|jgi:hypothetical protein|uniref:hypothetical protein n=1 Tax=Trichloromonas sp. TaxID=3069249 RepID=UPI002A37C851|nr:hypothetical protein [Trichloromonas sp.]